MPVKYIAKEDFRASPRMDGKSFTYMKGDFIPAVLVNYALSMGLCEQYIPKKIISNKATGPKQNKKRSD